MHGQRFRGQGSVCIAITVRHALCVSTQSEHNCDAARFTYEDYQSPKTFWLFKCHQVLGPLQPFYPELTWICKSARSRSTRGTSFTLRGLSTLVYTVCGLQRDLVARSRTPAGMVPLSARRVPDRSTGPPTLVLSGAQGRAGPFRVRTPYRGRRVALKRAGAGSVRGDGAEAQPAAGSSLSGEPSQGAVGAPLADAIRQAQPDAGSEPAAPGSAGGKVALPDTELVAKLSKDNKAVGVVAVAIGVGAVVGAREV